MRHFFITAFLLLSFVASAQHVIKGKVVGEESRPLIGATVIIQVDNKTLGVNTDENGDFSFENLREKSYNLTVSFLGYRTKSELVNADSELIIRLSPQSYSIKEISVYSLRASDKSPVAYSNVSAAEIEKRNGGQDIPYLLSLTPSFIATSEAGTGIGYTGFRIRGTDANRTNVTVNGVPINDAESHGTFFVNMPDFASSLSSVQIQRGVGTSTNGAAAFGASINMETEELRDNPYAEVSGTAGSFNTRKYTIKGGTGLLNNNLAFDARVSGINSDGYIDRAFVDLKSYYASAGYYGDKTTVKFITFGGKEKTYQAWNGVDLDLVASNPLEYKRTYNEIGQYTDDDGNVKHYDNQTDNYTQIHYQLHWKQEFTPNLSLNTGLHYTDGKGYYEEYRTNRSYVEYGLTPTVENGVTLSKTDLIRQKWLDNDFYGLIFALNYQTSVLNATFGGSVNRYDGDHFGKVIWVRNPNDDYDADKDWYRNTGVKDDANVYAKASFKIVENLIASADLQYRHIEYRMSGSDDKYDDDNNTMRDITQNHTYNFFNPKVGLNYSINRNNDIYASFSIANREPNRNNYTDASENEHPTSERLYDTEIGYRFQSPTVSLGVNLYNMSYKDQLILTGKISEIGEALTTNIPNSYRRGIELTAGVKLSSNFRWDGNLALSQNKIKNFTEYVTIYDENWKPSGANVFEYKLTDISYSPNIVFNSIFNFDYKGLNLAFYSSYVGRQYVDNTGSKTRSFDPYFVNNIAVNYFLPLKIIQGINFQVLVNNLFNVEYSSNAYGWSEFYVGDPTRYNYQYYFPQAGTNFSVSATFKL